MSSLRIGQLARAAGLTEKTLRYYDKIGLLTPTGRSASGYRIYDDEALDRLRFIRTAQDLGLSLKDVQNILDISDGGRTPCQHVLAVVERELGQIDGELSRLRELRHALLGAKSRLDSVLASGRGEPGHACQCIVVVESGAEHRSARTQTSRALSRFTRSSA